MTEEWGGMLKVGKSHMTRTCSRGVTPTESVPTDPHCNSVWHGIECRGVPLRVEAYAT